MMRSRIAIGRTSERIPVVATILVRLHLQTLPKGEADNPAKATESSNGTTQFGTINPPPGWPRRVNHLTAGRLLRPNNPFKSAIWTERQARGNLASTPPVARKLHILVTRSAN
jgi:hypothetical protein